MKRQRLKHQADNLAQMACGWRIASDLHQLTQMGAGRIEIDALTGQAQYQGRTLHRLVLAQELAAWLKRDGEENGIPSGYIRKAQVVLDFSSTTDAHREQVSFSRRASSLVETEDRTYAGTFEKRDEPPYLL